MSPRAPSTAHRRATRPRPTSRRPSSRRSSSPRGVNEVVAVGTGATIWPESLQANQSTYSPAWVATSEPGLESAVLGSSIAPKYLENVLTSSPVPSNYEIWHTPAVQQCDQVVRKAYPALKITPPTDPLTGSDQTFYAVESACINLALFDDDRQGGREEPDRVELRPCRLRAEERRHPRIRCAGLLRPGSGLRDRPGVPGDLRPGEERAAVCGVPGGEVTRTPKGRRWFAMTPSVRMAVSKPSQMYMPPLTPMIWPVM